MLMRKPGDVPVGVVAELLTGLADALITTSGGDDLDNGCEVDAKVGSLGVYSEAEGPCGSYEG